MNASVAARRRAVMVVWVAVGLLLIWRGLPYAGAREAPGVVGLDGADTAIALATGLVVGIGKGLTALRKGARRAVRHIEEQGATAPLWTVFSLKMIGLVALMVAAGLALRLSPYDPGVKAWVVGILYPGIGVALIVGGVLALSVPALEDRPS